VWICQNLSFFVALWSVGRFGLCGLCYVGGVLGDRLVGSWRGWLNVGFGGVIERSEKIRLWWGVLRVFVRGDVIFGGARVGF
jgi:hypothetical protein